MMPNTGLVSDMNNRHSVNELWTQCGTPIYEALCWANWQLQQRREQVKHLVLLTDGEDSGLCTIEVQDGYPKKVKKATSNMPLFYNGKIHPCHLARRNAIDDLVKNMERSFVLTEFFYQR